MQQISIISIAKNSVKFTVIKVITALAGLGVTLYAATILTPEQYGNYGILSLWLLYTGLATPGLYNAVSREIPGHIGTGREKEANRSQNISVSAELLYTVIPLAVIIGAAFLYTDSVMRIGMLIIAASYVTSRISNIWSHLTFIREKFNTVVGGNIIVAIISPTIILATLHWLGIYALIIGPLAAYIGSMIYYLVRDPLGFQFSLDRREIVRLLKVGIVLQGQAIAFWAFRIMDRTIVASALPREQLGFYVFATGFLMNALVLFQDFTQVLQPVLWRQAGVTGNANEGFRDTTRITVYLALGTAIFIPLAQLILTLLVRFVAKSYTESIPIFNVLSFNLYLMALAIIPSIVLNSTLVNKQNITLLFYSVALAISAGLDVLMVKLGYGVIGVAWVTIGCQGLVTFTLYYFIRKYVFDKRSERIKFAAIITIPFLACLPFYFLHHHLNNASTGMGIYAGISLACQVAVWTAVILVFYRKYVSGTEFRLILKEIRERFSK
jgi:O-antigen/teichoic acid export membrane protein